MFSKISSVSDLKQDLVFYILLFIEHHKKKEGIFQHFLHVSTTDLHFIDQHKDSIYLKWKENPK